MMVAGSKKRLPPPVLFSIPSNITGRPPLCSEHWGTAIESKSQMTTSSYTTRNFSNLISFRPCAVSCARRPRTIESSFQTRSHLLREGGLAWSTTTYAERPQFHRGGSANRGDQPGRPPRPSGISPLLSGVSPQPEPHQKSFVNR